MQMKDNQQSPLILSQTLQIMSMNVGREGMTQDITSSRACKLHVDVLLIEELQCLGRTKSLPCFDQNPAFGGNDMQPWAVTYT